jgi:protein-S-isoprenylcysteine O-methyltransferase Ste14
MKGWTTLPAVTLWPMLWFRGLVFTLLIPAVVGGVAPWRLHQGHSAAGGFWQVGWLLLACGGLVYFLCLLRFLAAGGTPVIHLLPAPVKSLLGTEPQGLIHAGIYRVSRNPMYLGVTSLIFGQAILFKSALVAAYGVIVWLCFYGIVVFVEEPHLREQHGSSYQQFCQRVPRWIGWPR